MMDNHVKIYLSVLLFLFSYCTTSYGQTADTALEAKIWKGIGGKENWQKARYFMFSCLGGKGQHFVQGERRYLWDKQTGDCRFEGITADEDTLVVLFNLKTSSGAAYVNEEQQEDQQATTLVEEALSAFETDANLLFLPTSLEGKDVSYIVEEEKLIGSKRFKVIKLQNHKTSFETSVKGLLYINEQTGHIQHWLPTQTDQPIYYAISGFKDIGGGLVLPTRFSGNDSTATITYPLAAALVNIEAHKFNRP
ncbi:hypothetical protein [Parapedobacter lycopersici]|uniref:hypothetical protein n=1 Tax=Parapedobacter lycopersici TaxID=1864939 RepID=UPI00333EBE21